MNNCIAYSTGETVLLTLSKKNMHTLEQLQGKTFRELKKIGWELNVLPEGDHRRRETWIKAIAGVKRPLLQLLEVSPAAEVVEQAQEPSEVQA
jgi:hypothetical protein